MAMIEANKLNVAAAMAKAREARLQREAERRHEASPQAPPTDENAPPTDGDAEKKDDFAGQTGDDSGQ